MPTDYSVLTEAEPNETADQASEVTLPFLLEGAIERPGDVEASYASSEKLRTELAVQSDGYRAANAGTFQEGRAGWMISARKGNPSDLLEALDADPSYDPSYHDGLAKLRIDLGRRDPDTPPGRLARFVQQPSDVQ